MLIKTNSITSSVNSCYEPKTIRNNHHYGTDKITFLHLYKKRSELSDDNTIFFNGQYTNPEKIKVDEIKKISDFKEIDMSINFHALSDSDWQSINSKIDINGARPIHFIVDTSDNLFVLLFSYTSNSGYFIWDFYSLNSDYDSIIDEIRFDSAINMGDINISPSGVSSNFLNMSSSNTMQFSIDPSEYLPETVTYSVSITKYTDYKQIETIASHLISQGMSTTMDYSSTLDWENVEAVLTYYYRQQNLGTGSLDFKETKFSSILKYTPQTNGDYYFQVSTEPGAIVTSGDMSRGYASEWFEDYFKNLQIACKNGILQAIPIHNLPEIREDGEPTATNGPAAEKVRIEIKMKYNTCEKIIYGISTDTVTHNYVGNDNGTAVNKTTNISMGGSTTITLHNGIRYLLEYTYNGNDPIIVYRSKFLDTDNKRCWYPIIPELIFSTTEYGGKEWNMDLSLNMKQAPTISVKKVEIPSNFENKKMLVLKSNGELVYRQGSSVNQGEYILFFIEGMK